MDTSRRSLVARIKNIFAIQEKVQPRFLFYLLYCLFGLFVVVFACIHSRVMAKKKQLESQIFVSYIFFSSLSFSAAHHVISHRWRRNSQGQHPAPTNLEPIKNDEREYI